MTNLAANPPAYIDADTRKKANEPSLADITKWLYLYTYPQDHPHVHTHHGQDIGPGLTVLVHSDQAADSSLRRTLVKVPNGRVRVRRYNLSYKRVVAALRGGMWPPEYIVTRAPPIISSKPYAADRYRRKTEPSLSDINNWFYLGANPVTPESQAGQPQPRTLILLHRHNAGNRPIKDTPVKITPTGRIRSRGFELPAKRVIQALTDGAWPVDMRAPSMARSVARDPGVAEQMLKWRMKTIPYMVLRQDTDPPDPSLSRTDRLRVATQAEWQGLAQRYDSEFGKPDGAPDAGQIL